MAKIKNDGYYSFKRTLSLYPDAKYYIIFGERSNGKSYAILEYALEKFEESGYTEAFGYIRRWSEDVVSRLMMQVFKSLKCNDKNVNVISKITKGKYNEVLVKNKCFYLALRNEESGEIENVLESQPLGYIFSLSLSERIKSTGYPDIKTIMFDEFIAEGLPMVNEFSRFRSILSTIIRNRDDVKIILCGNTINKHNIYFNEFGLKKTKYQKPGTIDIYRYDDEDKELIIVCEYADFPNRKQIKKSNVYFAFDKEKNKMIRTGEWDIGEYPHLEYFYTPADIKLMYFIKYEDEIYQCEIITVKDCKATRIDNESEDMCYSNKKIAFTYIHEKTTKIKDTDKHIIFQKPYSSLPNVRQDIMNAYDDIGKFIKSFFISGKVFFQDNNVGDAINAFIDSMK